MLYYNVESTREWNSSVGLIEVRIMYLVKGVNLHLPSVEFIGVFRPGHTRVVLLTDIFLFTI